MSLRKRKRDEQNGNVEPAVKQLKSTETTKLLSNSKSKPSATGTASNEDTSGGANKLDFLNNHKIFILKAGIEKARLQIFETQLKKYGGELYSNYNETVTHIVVDDKVQVEKLCRLLKLDKPPEKVVIVKSAWLSACFRMKQLANISEYLLHIESKSEVKPDSDNSITKLSDVISPENKDDKPNLNNDNAPIKKVGAMYQAFAKPPIRNDSDSDYVESDDSDFGEGTSSGINTASEFSSDSTLGVSPVKILPVGSWTCAHSSKNPKPNMNQAITAKLEEMVKNYESTNDKWRAFGYQKAIQALRSYPKQITTWEEARNLRGVGVKLADKIWEIVQSGELRKLNEFKSCDDIKILNLFTDVWGAGPTTARAWYQQGFRSLDDLKTKAKLTSQQKVGVRLYDDLIERMPHSEAGEIEVVVREAAESLQEGVISQACGSYRRGKATCGDVDVLITHPDGKSHHGLFSKLITKLSDEGFLTDHLVSVDDAENQKKYLGVCKLKGENRKHRRLDIIVVPYEEYGCALVYFTGSAHFNRSLRHLAKKLNMSLNEHALKYGVVRKGNEKIHDGTIIPTPTEKSVFEQFKIPYRTPEERDH